MSSDDRLRLSLIEQLMGLIAQGNPAPSTVSAPRAESAMLQLARSPTGAATTLRREEPQARTPLASSTHQTTSPHALGLQPGTMDSQMQLALNMAQLQMIQQLQQQQQVSGLPQQPSQLLSSVQPPQQQQQQQILTGLSQQETISTLLSSVLAVPAASVTTPVDAANQILLGQMQANQALLQASQQALTSSQGARIPQFAASNTGAVGQRFDNPKNGGGSDSSKPAGTAKSVTSSSDGGSMEAAAAPTGASIVARLAGPEPFPEKLYRLLHEVEENGTDDIISFTPSGRAFRIHRPERFVEEIAPRYFKHKNIGSFKRQLHFYHFAKVSTGPEDGCYFHPDFQRGRPDLLPHVRRVMRLELAKQPT